jgi:hypothetical protein
MQISITSFSVGRKGERSPDTADTKGKGGLVCFVDPSLPQLGLLPCTSCSSTRDIFSNTANMGTEDSVEVDRSATSEEKAVDILTPPELELPEYPTSNLHLLILGAAFFALWAGSVS